MERACGVGAGGRGASAVDAHGQAHQCRVSLRSLNPAGQYHDAGAGHLGDAVRAARGGIDRQCDSAVTASSCSSGGADAGCGEKAGGRKTATRALRTGFDCTGSSTNSRTSAGSCRRE